MTYDEEFTRNLDEKIAGDAGDGCGDSPSAPPSGLSPEGEKNLELTEREQSDNSPTPRHDGWTPEARVKFLDALAECGNVTSAAYYVQRSRTAAYSLKRRDSDFSRTWDAALLLARDGATEMLQDRAMNGITEEIYHGGEVVGTRQRYDNRLLLAHIARLDRLAERASVSRGAARFDQMIDAIAAGEDTSTFISEPTTDELLDMISRVEAESAVRQVEEECEHQRQVAHYHAIKAEEKKEKEAEEEAEEARTEAQYGPTYEIDWADGGPLDYGRFTDEAAQKLCTDHPHVKIRRVAWNDPQLVAAMTWPGD